MKIIIGGYIIEIVKRTMNLLLLFKLALDIIDNWLIKVTNFIGVYWTISKIIFSIT